MDFSWLDDLARAIRWLFWAGVASFVAFILTAVALAIVLVA